MFWSLANKTIVTSIFYNWFMHEFTYLLIAFTIVLCLAVLVIIVLNKTVSKLQKENTRLTSKADRPRGSEVENASNRNEPGWQQVEPMKVARQIYDSGMTNLN